MNEFYKKLEDELAKTIPNSDQWIDSSYQPERSKREDIEDLKHDFVTVGCTDHRYCTKCREEDHVIKSKMMRCSEHYGDIVREVQ